MKASPGLFVVPTEVGELELWLCEVAVDVDHSCYWLPVVKHLSYFFVISFF